MLFSPALVSTPLAARAGLLMALVLAVASAGCGQRACIEWSQFEGVCPSAAEPSRATRPEELPGEGARTAPALRARDADESGGSMLMPNMRGFWPITAAAKMFIT